MSHLQNLFQVNTERAEFLSQGMNHVEGGWPKDINPSENDQTMRFRKKIEKDDNYVGTVLGLCSVGVQGGPSGWVIGFVDIKTKVLSKYRLRQLNPNVLQYVFWKFPLLAWAAWQLQYRQRTGELSEGILQNIRNRLQPQTVLNTVFNLISTKASNQPCIKVYSTIHTTLLAHSLEN